MKRYSVDPYISAVAYLAGYWTSDMDPHCSKVADHYVPALIVYGRNALYLSMDKAFLGGALAYDDRN